MFDNLIHLEHANIVKFHKYWADTMDNRARVSLRPCEMSLNPHPVICNHNITIVKHYKMKSKFFCLIYVMSTVP